MMAGVRNLKTGECTLLATGVIAAHEGGTAGEAARIGPDTARVIFKLTALTAEIKAAPGSAFNITPVANYGTTTIGDTQHPVFEIKAASTAGVDTPTSAELALSGWGNGAEENDTNQFIYLVHDKTQTFGLAGIGTNTNEGDAPLPSTANITWSITNNAGLLGSNPIEITFTSKSTAAEASGMGWLPVRVAVQAFSDTAGGQVWQVGSGILRNQLDAGAGTEGAGIVILHGKKMSKPGVGAQQDWLWEYVLDLGNPNPAAVAGMWEYDAPTTGPNTAGVYRLTGHKAKTVVRVINSTTDHGIEVKDNAEVTVLLDDMSIDLATGTFYGTPFKMGAGSKVTMYLKDTNTLEAYYAYSNIVAGLQTTGAELTIQESSGSSPGTLTAISSYLGAGIGGANGTAGGTIIIKSGIIKALGRNSAGIGGGSDFTGSAGGDGGTVIIEGGDITAYGTSRGVGIGGGAAILGGNGGKGADILIKGGTVKAHGDTGIGGGGTCARSGFSGAGGNGGNFEITGGLVIAEGAGSAGIGGGRGDDDTFGGSAIGGAGVAGSDSIKISGGTVIARSLGSGGAGIGGGFSRSDAGGKAIDGSGKIIISGGVVFAEGGDGTTDGAGIGNGAGSSTASSSGNIEITGGTVYARGGPSAQGIGLAEGGGTAPTITKTGSPVIFASSVNSGITQDPDNAILMAAGVTIDPIIGSGTSNSVFDTATYTGFQGYTLAVTANSGFTVPATASLGVLPGMTFALGSGPLTLTNNGTIVNRGTITINSGNTLDTTVGTVDNTDGILTMNSGTLNGPSNVSSGGTVN
jgi:hypothetical protein